MDRPLRVVCVIAVLAGTTVLAVEGVAAPPLPRRYVPRHERLAADGPQGRGGTYGEIGFQHATNAMTSSPRNPRHVAPTSSLDDADPLPAPVDAGAAPFDLDLPPAPHPQWLSADVEQPVSGGPDVVPTCAECQAPCGSPCVSAPFSDCSECGGCGDGAAGGMCPYPSSHWTRELSLFAGVQGFKAGPNRGRDGSFGFHEGFQWGAPVFVDVCDGMSLQLGVRATHNNFSAAEFARGSRDQFFATTGLFRRTDAGLQGGVVVDYLHDSWYFNIDLAQVRGELSLALGNLRDFGARFAVSATQDSAPSTLIGARTVEETWEARDYGAVFYRQRYRTSCQGDWTIFGGITGNSEGIIGAESNVPLNCFLAVQPVFTYVIPDSPTGPLGQQEESWNLGISLVWHPRAPQNGYVRSYDQPLLPVADNGSFIVRRVE